MQIYSQIFAEENVQLYSQSFEQTLFEDIVKLRMIYINEYQT